MELTESEGCQYSNFSFLLNFTFKYKGKSTLACCGER